MTTIRQMTYQPPGTAGTATVETMTFARLREMNDGGTQRADFHVLAVVDTGPGSVTVDFRQHSLGPRSAVWIRPGAVHRWDDIAGVTGRIVLFLPTAPVTPATRDLAATPGLEPHWPITTDQWPLVDMALAHLILETHAADIRETHAGGVLQSHAGGVLQSHADGVLRSHADGPSELPQILLSALLARLRPPHAGPPAVNPIFRLFQASVEVNFRHHHDAEFYARSLGYAPRTLSRAAQQATGRTAKAYLVDRLILEAKRLLAHDRLTAAGCAAALGFPDASNFSLFFRNATGLRPGAWQKTMAP